MMKVENRQFIKDSGKALTEATFDLLIKCVGSTEILFSHFSVFPYFAKKSSGQCLQRMIGNLCLCVWTHCSWHISVSQLDVQVWCGEPSLFFGK